MTSTKLHLFSDGRTHIAYHPETRIFYRLDDAAWESRDVADDAFLTAPTLPSSAASKIQGTSSNAAPAASPWTLERLVMVITTHCNLRCRYCYAEGGHYGTTRQHMQPELARQALAWVLELFETVGVVQFFGGEPSLNTKAIAAICEQFDAHVAAGRLAQPPGYAMVTNGTFLPPRLEALIRRYNMHLTYSVDGPSVVHNMNRFYASGRGSYDDMIKHYHQMQDSGVTSLGVEMTFSPQALDAGYGVWELAQFAKSELGVSEAHIPPVASEPGAVTSWGERYPEGIASYRQATFSALQSLMDGQYTGFSFVSSMLRSLIKKTSRDYICPAGVGTLAIDPEGEVYPCFMFVGKPELSLGNVHHRPDRADFARRLQAFTRHNHKDSHAECGNCWARDLCSGCMGDIMLSTGSLSSESPMLCGIIRAVAEETMLFLARVQSDPATWKRFVANYRGWQLDKANPKELVV